MEFSTASKRHGQSWQELKYKAVKEPFLAFSFLLILFSILESKTGTYNINECTPLLQ